MSTEVIFQTDSSSSDDTEKLAALLGARLKGGEVIVLVSDLGGGKTTFVRGLARGMGSQDHVSSPTFTISREYVARKLTLHHFDFYRLQEPGIIAAELDEFIHDPAAVTVIEWGDIVADVLPEERLTVRIENSGDSERRLLFSAPESLQYLIDGVKS